MCPDKDLIVFFVFSMWKTKYLVMLRSKDLILACLQVDVCIVKMGAHLNFLFYIYFLLLG